MALFFGFRCCCCCCWFVSGLYSHLLPIFVSNSFSSFFVVAVLTWIGALQFSKLLNYLMFILFPRQQIQPQESPYRARSSISHVQFQTGEIVAVFFCIFILPSVFLSLKRFFSHVTSSLHLNENWTILCTMHKHHTLSLKYLRIQWKEQKQMEKERKKKQYSKPNISIFRQSLNKINPRVRSLMACFYLQPLAVHIWYEWNALHRWCFVQIKLKLKYLLGKRNELKFGKIKSSFGNKHRHFLK